MTHTTDPRATLAHCRELLEARRNATTFVQTATIAALLDLAEGWLEPVVWKRPPGASSEWPGPNYDAALSILQVAAEQLGVAQTPQVGRSG